MKKILTISILIFSFSALPAFAAENYADTFSVPVSKTGYSAEEYGKAACVRAIDSAYRDHKRLSKNWTADESTTDDGKTVKASCTVHTVGK